MENEVFALGNRLYPIVHDDIGRVPITDIARATGVRKRSFLRVLDKNPDTFAPHTRDAQLGTPGGKQTARWIDAEGLRLLLFEISSKHIRDPKVKERVEKFRAWQLNKLVQADRPLPVPAPITKTPHEQKPPSAIAYEASRFAKMTGANQREVAAAMLREAGYGYLVPLLPDDLPKVPAPSMKPAHWLNASDIGDLIGKTAAQVNSFLELHKHIIRDGERPGEWRITDSGRLYGEERFYEPVPGKSMFRVFWRRDVLAVFNCSHLI